VTTPQRRGAASPAQQTPTQHRSNGRAAGRSAVAEPTLAEQTAAGQIGVKPGTGGSPGAPYLHARVPLRYYPMLWQLREYL
jgi:hypothetical protein